MLKNPRALTATFALFLTAATTGQDIDPDSDRNVRPHPGTPVNGYRLAWSDEFNGTEINGNKWYYRTGSKMWSTQLPANNSVSDGLYRIHLKKEKAADKDYSGGGIISKKLFRYGYYEARMKATGGEGWHSSFWMMRDMEYRDVRPDVPHIELDVVETDSSDLFHFQTDAHRWSPKPHRKFGTKQVTTKLPLSEFHVYGLEFTPTELRYFFNGELVRAADASEFPHNDVNIWLTCLAAKMGKKTTKVDDAKLPSETQFDYVRFFTASPSAEVEITSPSASSVSLADPGVVLPVEARITPSQTGLLPEVRWKQLSGPEGVRFTDPELPSTAVRFPETGTYLLECSATVGSSVRSTTVSVSIDAPVSTSLRQRVDGYEGLSTYIRGLESTRNSGGDHEMMVGRWQGKPNRGLLSFPLDGIASNVRIEQAELTLWNVDGFGTTGPIELRTLATPFLQGEGDGFTNRSGAGTGATWKTRDGRNPWPVMGGDIGETALTRIPAFDTQAFEPMTFPSSEEFVAAVQEALSDKKPLNLAILSEGKDTPTNAMARFASNRSIADLRPTLTLTYRGNHLPEISPMEAEIEAPKLNASLECDAKRSTGTRWSQISGPGTATFSHANRGNSKVSFDQPGNYTLRFTATNKLGRVYRQVEISAAE